jgi:hypothetical protein
VGTGAKIVRARTRGGKKRAKGMKGVRKDSAKEGSVSSLAKR